MGIDRQFSALDLTTMITKLGDIETAIGSINLYGGGAPFDYHYLAVQNNTNPQAIWTPATGKKFVIQKILLCCKPHTSLYKIDFLDNAAVIFQMAVPTDHIEDDLIPITFEGGIRSIAVDNVLNIKQYTALNEYIRIAAFGYEI